MMTEVVLVVDDEEEIREILTAWLEDAGYETYSASNGLEALQKLYYQIPDLVVSDVLMPQMDGYEMCRLMRELSGTPILFLSGLGMETDKKKGFRQGADEYITKPVEMDDFLSRVSSLLIGRDRRGTAPPIIDALQSYRLTLPNAQDDHNTTG